MGGSFADPGSSPGECDVAPRDVVQLLGASPNREWPCLVPSRSLIAKRRHHVGAWPSPDAIASGSFTGPYLQSMWNARSLLIVISAQADVVTASAFCGPSVFVGK
jgi:hypothetical protein